MAIVNEAWDFDRRLHPQSLADLVKRLYKAGTLAESRYARVIERDGEVEAFLFGRAGAGIRTATVQRRARSVAYAAEPSSHAFWCRYRRQTWLATSCRAHQTARIRVEPIGDGEVTLFATATASRGKNYGRQLMGACVEHCRHLGVERLIVKTDVDSTYGFYDHYDFTMVAEFTSPMNQRFSGGSGRSFVYELRL